MLLTRGPLPLALQFLAGILAPMTAAQPPSCAGDNAAKFSEFADPMEISTKHVHRSKGFLQFVVWMHSVFGSTLLPTEEPEYVIRGLKIAKSPLDIVSALLFGAGESMVLLSFGLVAAIFVPLLALGILCSRFACGLCGGGEPSGEPENITETVRRKKWSIIFCAVTAFMAFMLLCGYVTKNHLPVAFEGARTQAYFLVNTLPLIFERLRQDFDVLVDVNLKEFLGTVARRGISCRKEATNVVQAISQPGMMLEFLDTTAKRLQTIQESLKAVHEATTSPKIVNVRDKLNPAMAALRSAAQLCTPPCDAKLNQQLAQTTDALDIDRQIQLPKEFTELQTALKDDIMQEDLGKIPTADSLNTVIDRIIKRINKAVAEFQRKLTGNVKEGDVTLRKKYQEYYIALRKFEKEATALGDQIVMLYQLVLGLTCAVMVIIVLLYISAIYSGFGQSKKGFCGLYMASWMLSAAVVLFLLMFPVALVVSTTALIFGTIVDRFFCIPAQNPGSPASIAIIDYVITTVLEARAMAQGRRDDNTGILFAARVSMENHADFEPTSNRWKRDDIVKCERHAGKVEEQMITNINSTLPEIKHQMEQHVKTTSAYKQERSSRHTNKYARESIVLKNNTVQTLEKRPSQTALADQKHIIPAALQTLSSDRRLGPGNPQAQDDSSVLTRDAILKIAERFGKCSSSHLSYLHLFGDELTLQLTAKYLGAAGETIIAILDKDRPLPNIATLAQQSGGNQALQIGAQVREKLSQISNLKNILDSIATLPISVEAFQQLSDTAAQSKTSFSDVESTKYSLRSLAEDLPIPEVKAKIVEATDELDKITANDKNDFQEEMDAIIAASKDLTNASMVNGLNLSEYVRDNMDNWDGKMADFTQSVDQLIVKMEGMKAGLGKDLENFFGHARTQLRDFFGDCHVIYILYMTTIDTFCDGAVRLFAAFWFSIWWYLVMGIPGWMLALAMSTFYYKLAMVSDSYTYF